MKTIDLLPKEAKKSDVKGLLLNIAFILFVIIFIIVLFLSIFLFDVGRVLSSRISDYEMVNMRMQGDIDRIRTYEEYRGEIDTREELVEELEKYEQSWHITLMEFSDSMPAGAYVSYIDGNTREFYDYLDPEQEGEEKEPLTDKVLFFSLEGYAEKYNDVLRLAINLEDVPGVGEVWLDNISMDSISAEGIDVYSFVITAYWDLEPYAEVIGSADGGSQADTDTEEDTLEEELLNQ